MKRALLLLVICAACNASTPPPQPAPPSTAPPAKPPPPAAVTPAWGAEYQVEERFVDPDRMRKLTSAFPKIDEAISRAQKDLELPGLAVAVVIDGKVAHVATAGQRDLATQSPLTAETTFRIASVTKTVTAAAIVKLRDAGKLQLDDPAVRYLPELAKVRYPSRDSRPITLRHLLTHSSGLARDIAGGRERETVKGPTSAVLSRVLDGMPLAFAPGSRELYSNLGFALLGVVVERVSKTPYRSYLAKHFFEPLGLGSAAWDQSRVPADRLATAYELGKDGAQSPVEKHEVLGIGDASGGLYLSVADLGKWVGWQLSAYPARSDAETGPLARASIREMHDVSGGVNVNVASPFTALEPWVAEPWAGGMTLGWNATALCDIDLLLEKSGFLDQHYSEVGFFPNEGIGLVAVTNGGRRGKFKRRTFFDVLKLLRETGGFAPRVRLTEHATALNRALGRVLGVMNQWDESQYLAMLTAHHKKYVPMQNERNELASYHALHGRCSGGTILRFDSPEHARYLVTCERGRLEMVLSVIDGQIAGFTGYSTQVEADPKARAAADAALKEKKHQQRFGKCKLGALKERSGFGWHLFDLSCQRGPAGLRLQLDATGNAKLETLEIAATDSGPCAELVKPK